MHTVAKVAERFGPSFWSVRDQPYADTLEAYLAVLDLERLDDLDARHRQDRGSALTNLAFANHRMLQRELDKSEARLNHAPRRFEVEPEELQLDWPGMPNYKPPPSDKPQNVRVPTRRTKRVS